MKTEVIRRVLVVGGNGYLGAHTVGRFRRRGWHATVLDLPGTAARAHPLNGADDPQLLPVAQREGRVTDLADLREAFETANPDVCVVLSSYGEPGRGLVRSAEQNPSAAVDVNIGGLLAVLDHLASHPRTRLLWLSSTTVYGPASLYGSQPVGVDTPVQPASIYAATKVLGEQLLRSYRAKHGIDAAAVRPTLVWGPGMTYDGVQSDLNRLVEAAAAGSALTVASAAEQWDLVYVKDAAEAIVHLAESVPLPPVVHVNGFRASLEDVCAELSTRSTAPLGTVGGGVSLGVPLVDDAEMRAIGFTPRFDLAASVEDFITHIRATQKDAP